MIFDILFTRSIPLKAARLLVDPRFRTPSLWSSESAPSKFSYTAAEGFTVRKRSGAGALDSAYVRAPVDGWDASHPAAKALIGTGPWAWAGISPMAFLANGVLVSPWGEGSYVGVAGSEDTVRVTFVGAKHTVVYEGCHKFRSVRESDGAKVDGWVQLGQSAVSYTHLRAHETDSYL
eukprot:6185117-Pleurochrysis_carterae.AAC.1